VNAENGLATESHHRPSRLNDNRYNKNRNNNNFTCSIFDYRAINVYIFIISASSYLKATNVRVHSMKWEKNKIRLSSGPSSGT